MSKKRVKELQGGLDIINRWGSVMRCTTEGWTDFVAMIDSFTVLEADDESALILWKGVYYDLDDASSKMTRFTVKPDEVSVSKAHGEQWLSFDLEDDLGRVYRVEAIEKRTEPREHAAWVKWSKYKRSKAKFFQTIDRHMIEGWPDVAVTF